MRLSCSECKEFSNLIGAQSIAPQISLLAKISTFNNLPSFVDNFYTKSIPKNFSCFSQSHDSFCLRKSPRKQNGSTFSFSKIGNICIKIRISDLHLAKLPPIYIFQIYPKSNFFSFSRDMSVSARQILLDKKYLLDN